jgi:16S rRNA (uracil1498-N3)-methyltransferase
MRRFYVLPSQISGETITISGSDVNHIKNVLRKNIGDEIVCFDGSGKEYLSKIVSMDKDTIKLSIHSSNHPSFVPQGGTSEDKPSIDHSVKITLAQGLPKSSKMDDIIKNSTELGVHEIIPVLTEWSVAKGEKLERWKKIAKEASQQSGRSTVPEIKELISFDNFLSIKHPHELKLIPWESEQRKTLKNILKEHPGTRSVCILIGPEGGFSHEEIKKASDAGFISVCLGKTILRTETAGPAVIAMVTYELDR